MTPPKKPKDTEDQNDMVEATAEEVVEIDTPEVILDEDSAAEDASAEAIEHDTDTVEDSADTDEAEPVEAAPVEESVSEIPAPPPPAAQQKSGPGLVPLVIGGLIAGGIGYGAATLQPDPPIPSAEAPVIDLSGLETAQADATQRLDALEQQIANASSGAPVAFDSSALENALADLQGSLSGIEGRLVALEEDLGVFEDRLIAEETKPQPPITADGTQAMAEQLASFQAELDAVTEAARVEIEAAQTRASEIEAAALEAEDLAERRAALAAVEAALESGAPFDAALGVFDDVPEPLAAIAPAGVMPLAELKETFPDAARAALAETQVIPESGGVSDRLTAFLRRQTNARSLSPRDGDDADAVLSRAEAALQSGDLDLALSELEALPPEAAVPLAAWIKAAANRVAALAGAETLAAAERVN